MLHNITASKFNFLTKLSFLYPTYHGKESPLTRLHQSQFTPTNLSLVQSLFLYFGGVTTLPLLPYSCDFFLPSNPSPTPREEFQWWGGEHR